MVLSFTTSYFNEIGLIYIVKFEDMIQKLILFVLALLVGQEGISQNFYNLKSTFYTKFIKETNDGDNLWFVKDDLSFERTDGDTNFYSLKRETLIKKQSKDLPLSDLLVLEIDDKVIVRGRVGSINYYGEGATLFDFSLKEGDTVSFIDPILSSQPTIQYVIDSIGFKKFVDNSTRKTQYIRPLFNYLGPPIFISEGIGPSNGILGFIDEMLMLRFDNGYSELVSVCFNDNIRYSNSSYRHIGTESCDSDTFKQRILLNTIEPKSRPTERIYPNPATSSLFLDQIQFDELYIFSSDGKQLMYHNTPIDEIPISHFPKGIYFIRSVYHNQWSVHRFQKK